MTTLTREKWLLIPALLLSSNVFATNGDNMIGFGAISRGMGGTGIALPMGAESTLKNPAMLPLGRKANEFSFAGTYFAPKVSSTNSLVGTEAKSKADSFLIPAIGLTYRMSDDLVFGLGAYGTSGMGVDFKQETTAGLYRMNTNLSIMKFVPSLAYQYNNFTFGASLAAMYGALSIAYDRGLTLAAGSGGGAVGFESPGVSQDLGAGYNFGLGYVFDNLIVGLTYQSKIKMTYDNQLSDASRDFQMANALADHLAQPEEFGGGLSYQLANWTFTTDYKIIKWETAEGYRDFGWEDQEVLALGASYSLGDETFIRLGYNHGSSPLKGKALNNVTGTDDYSKHALNMIGFPATVENHYTIGATHRFTRIFALDVAYVYASEYESTARAYSQQATSEFNITNKHSQSAYTFSLRWLM